MCYSQDGGWQILEWERLTDGFLAELRLTRAADWQMNYKETSERQSTGVLEVAPIPFSSTSTPQPRPSNLAPLLLFLHMSVNLSLWQPHPRGRGGGGCLSSDK